MTSATDTDTTADTKIKSCHFENLETWQEKEKRRLSNILEYNLENFDIEDQGLHSITKLAAMICGTPHSFITLVGEKYVRFLSRCENNLNGTIRLNSFCTIAIEQEQFFEIENSLEDNRFSENEFVKGQKNPLVYYGGFPVVSPKGYKFGSLCVTDGKPRRLNEMQKHAIKVLADEVMIHLELRRHNKELKLANERIERLSKIKEEFMHNVSHDLRTPLNAIAGYTEILYKTDLNTDQKEAISIIKSSCEFLTSLINDILDFSKIEHGKISLENIPFDLRKAIKNIKDLLNPKAKEKDLKFEIKIDEKIPKFIMGDKVRINQILMNLTGNALKFTNSGFVKMEVRYVTETPSEVKLLFSVKDSGIGIHEDKLNSVFERFEQAGNDIARKFGGTGLGLNISKNLVELYKSKLELKSVYGKGTEFFFTINFEKFIDEETNIRQNFQKNNDYLKKISDMKNINLLVCEDNLVNIKLIKAIFKNKEINIEVAENGKIAIDMLKKKNKFDIILMDLQMPEMNGFETTKYIRNIMNLNIPIIAFSASTSEIERKYCLEIGMNDYLLKTFGTNEIYDKLTDFINTNKVYVEDLEESLSSNLNKSKRSRISNNISKSSIKSLKKTNIHDVRKQSLINSTNRVRGIKGDDLIYNDLYSLNKKPHKSKKKKNRNKNELKGEDLYYKLKPVRPNLNKEKNYSNCEVMNTHMTPKSILSEEISIEKDKKKRIKNDNSKQKHNDKDVNHSQRIIYPKNFQINNSSEKCLTNSLENSDFGINNNKMSSIILKNSKNSSYENKINEEKIPKINFNTNYCNSDHEQKEVLRLNNSINLGIIKLKKMENEIFNYNTDANENDKDFFDKRSFNSEIIPIKRKSKYFKTCIYDKDEGKYSSTNLNSNNIYKYSKFNEHYTAKTNAFNSNNNSREFNNLNKTVEFEEEEKILLNYNDSENSNLHILTDQPEEIEDMVEKKIQRNANILKKNIEKSREMENYINDNNNNINENNVKKNKYSDKEIRSINSNHSKTERFEENKNEISISEKDPQSKVISRKSSISKINTPPNQNNKHNESLNLSLFSVKFENFDNDSDNENEDLLNFENANNIYGFEEDPEMRNELLEIFLDENPKQMKSLKSAIVSKNLEAIKFVAHTMKPSVLMFGHNKLYKKLEKIENICKTITLNKIKYLYDEIKKGLEIFYKESRNTLDL